MSNRYFIAGDKLLAFNAKCATSSFCNAIIKAHHPVILDKLVNHTHFPYGKTMDDMEQLHKYLPTRVNPDRPTALIVREPVDRFRSAIGFLRLSQKVDDVLRVMVEETNDPIVNDQGQLFASNRPVAADIHLMRQSRFLNDDADLTIFTIQDSEKCADWLGLATPLVRYNETSGPKPDLTDEQVDKIKQYYRRDIELWESING